MLQVYQSFQLNNLLVISILKKKKKIQTEEAHSFWIFNNGAHPKPRWISFWIFNNGALPKPRWITSWSHCGQTPNGFGLSFCEKSKNKQFDSEPVFNNPGGTASDTKTLCLVLTKNLVLTGLGCDDYLKFTVKQAASGFGTDDKS